MPPSHFQNIQIYIYTQTYIHMYIGYRNWSSRCVVLDQPFFVFVPCNSEVDPTFCLQIFFIESPAYSDLLSTTTIHCRLPIFTLTPYTLSTSPLCPFLFTSSTISQHQPSLLTMEPRICELCDAEAAVFCPSDAAYLCWTCDAQVHQANFLVARHFRHPLILTQLGEHDDGLDSLSSSNSSSKEYSFAGKKRSCSSSSVGELKTQDAKPRPPVDYFKTEDIFLNWIGKLGVGSEGAVGIGCRAFNVCLDRWKAWPLRLCLAASLCLGLRAKSVMTWKVLKRLEQLSSVPAKLILAAESKLDLRRDRRRRVELEEGWAEC